MQQNQVDADPPSSRQEDKKTLAAPKLQPSAPSSVNVSSSSGLPKVKDRSESSKMGSQMPSLDQSSQLNIPSSVFNPPNPNATITNFNSGVVVQANLDEPQAVELTPNLQGKKKVKKIKKAKKKETYLSLDDDSQAYGSMTGAKVEHSALQSFTLNHDDSTNPQERDNGMMPLDFDPNSNDVKVHGDDDDSRAHQSANPLDNKLIID